MYKIYYYKIKLYMCKILINYILFRIKKLSKAYYSSRFC